MYPAQGNKTNEKFNFWWFYNDNEQKDNYKRFNSVHKR